MSAQITEKCACGAELSIPTEAYGRASNLAAQATLDRVLREREKWVSKHRKCHLAAVSREDQER